MKSLFSLLLIAMSVNSYAKTSCTDTLERIWAGDQGYVWFFLAGGGSFKLLPSDPDQKSMLSMGMTALTTGNSITVRYTADDVNCASTSREDAEGIYLFGKKV